ncbi:PTS transporter subunit EIIC [Cetobacterium sp.]|uniref:PTS transporter subunit EIIC n=1 Tax=Cetobacterium sp. TaxID=2071632 RepID=UPI003F3199BF
MQKLKKELQSFGKTLLFPISILSFMAIFLGLSAALQNPNIVKFLPFLQGDTAQSILGFIRRLSGVPFAQLPLLFAMAIPLGVVKRDKEIAVYSAVVGYIAMLVGMNYLLAQQGYTPKTTEINYLVNLMGMSQVEATLHNALFTNVLGIFVYNMNVIGGMIAGLLGAAIHNKFRQVELHPALSFYSGKRFVPIATVLLMPLAGMALVYIWPVINNGIMSLGTIISKLGTFGVFLYGFVEKAINPTGLHHILNQAFRFTALGGIENVAGTTQVGGLNIYFAELENHLPFSPKATVYLAQGKILHMVFGMPGALFAMYKCALPEKREKFLKYFIPGLTAVILTGITEPIDFTFIFISPALWFMNSVLAGLAFMVPAILEVTIGNIQGGLIDWIVFGALQGTVTKWHFFLGIGPIFFIMYYFVYSFTIKKFNVMIIGRNSSDFEETENEGDCKVEEIKVGNPTGSSEAGVLIEGLGGLKNIVEVDNCISRLRIEVKDSSLVNQELIKRSKPNGVIVPDANNVHIVYGGRVTKMRNLLDDYIFGARS